MNEGERAWLDFCHEHEHEVFTSRESFLKGYAAAEAKAGEDAKVLLGAMREMERSQFVNTNIEAMRDFCTEGLKRAELALKNGGNVELALKVLALKNGGNVELALKVIDAALRFHPMYAEDWPGWPDEDTRTEAEKGNIP